MVSELYMKRNISFDFSEFLALLAALECVDNEQFKSTNKFTIIASDESGNSEAMDAIKKLKFLFQFFCDLSPILRKSQQSGGLLGCAKQ